MRIRKQAIRIVVIAQRERKDIFLLEGDSGGAFLP